MIFVLRVKKVKFILPTVLCWTFVGKNAIMFK